jgi:hypothetical protein
MMITRRHKGNKYKIYCFLRVFVSLCEEIMHQVVYPVFTGKNGACAVELLAVTWSCSMMQNVPGVSVKQTRNQSVEGRSMKSNLTDSIHFSASNPDTGRRFAFLF